MRSEKIQLVNDIGQMLTESDYLYFVSYTGVKVKNFNGLRLELAKNNANCHILKNSLIRKAAALHKMDKLAALELAGDTAMVYGKGDASKIAKLLKDFSKTQEKVAPKGGYLDGAVLSVADLDAVAAMPPKEVLQAMLLGLLQAPTRDFVSVLNAKVASVVNVLNNYQENLEKKS